MSAPIVSGFDVLTTSEVVVPDPGGQPTAILIAPLADWCSPHCSQHVEGSPSSLPPATPFLLTSTSWPLCPTTTHRLSTPKDEWLAGLGWDLPTLADTSTADTGRAYALTSVPTWILIDPDGKVAGFADGPVADVADVIARTLALVG